MTEFKWKVLITIIIVGLLAVLTVQMIDRGKWRARVDNLQAQVDTTNAKIQQYRVDSVARAQRDSVLDVRDSVLTVDSAAIALRADSVEEARLRTVRYAARLRAQLDSTELSPAVRSTLQAYEAALDTAEAAQEVCKEGKQNAEDRANNCEEQKALRDTTIADLEELRTNLTAERDSALVLLRPPPLFQLTFELTGGVGCAANLNSSACGASAQLTLFRFRLPWF